MASTKINSLPQSLASLIIFSLLFIAVSAFDLNVGFNANAKSTRPHSTMPLSTNKILSPRKRKNVKFLSDFVSAHNFARVPIGHPPMTWNYTLAYYAKQWAKKRVNDCKLIHSYGPYGENLFWGGASHWSPSAVVKSWVDEKFYYDPKSNSCAKGQMCGHYTQVIWKNTIRVGCARVKCYNGKGLYVICNYDPPGNYVNEHPFGDLVNGANLVKNALQITG
ncbi:hypothetical protein REPUB_Repub02eG0253200 [Reevesia pubescens]